MVAFPWKALNGLSVTVSGSRYHLEAAEVGKCRSSAIFAFESSPSACRRDQKQVLLAVACKAQKRPVTPHSVLDELHYLQEVLAGEVDVCGWSVELIGKDGKRRGRRVGTVDEIIELALVDGRANDEDAVIRPFGASAMGGIPGSDSDAGDLRRLQEDTTDGSRVRGPRELLLRVVEEEEEEDQHVKPRKGNRGRRNAQSQTVAVGGIDDSLGSGEATAAQERAATPVCDKVEHLIPLVPSIIGRVDAKKRCLVINPPEGLLELGRQQHCLQRLLPALMEFCEERERDRGRARETERERERERGIRNREAALRSDGESEESGATAGELPSCIASRLVRSCGCMLAYIIAAALFVLFAKKHPFLLSYRYTL